MRAFRQGVLHMNCEYYNRFERGLQSNQTEKRGQSDNTLSARILKEDFQPDLSGEKASYWRSSS